MTAFRCLPLAAALLTFAAASAPAPAPADEPKPIKLVPVWKQGDTYRYELTREQTRKVGDKDPTRTFARTPVEVEVAEVDEDNIVLRWTQGSAMFDDPKAGDDPQVKTMSVILKGVDIDLELNRDGEYQGIRNWKEVKSTGHKIQDLTLKNLAKAGTSKATVDAIRTATDPIFASKESVETAFGTQPSLLVVALGRTYEAGKPGTYEATLPNPFPTGEAYPCKGERILKGVDAATGVVQVTFKLTPDEKELTRIYQQTLRDIAKKSGKPVPDPIPEFKLEDVTEFEIDSKTGWVKSVTHTRTVTLGDTVQTEVIALTRKEK